MLKHGARRELAIWPIASTEQHGPHLPTGTDMLINEALQERLLADPPPGIALRILPTLAIGASEHHTPFGGTLSLPPVQYAAVLVRGIRCLLAQGHRRIVLLNSHGGNIGPMQSALAEVSVEATRQRALVGGFSYWTLCEEAWKAVRPALVTPRMGHACELETSLMLHLRPELVDMKRAKDDPFHPSLEQPIASALSFDAITRAGVIGYAARGTADKGRQLLDLAVARIRDALAAWLAA